jgi:hypothetical protein
MTVLQVSTAGTGVVRDAHYVTPTGASTPVRTLLLEPQRTNLCIRSQEFDNAAWSKVGVTVPTTDAIAPDGTATGAVLTDDGLAAANRLERACTFTGDGEKSLAVYLKAGTAAATAISLRDQTAAVHRHIVTVTWTAGVPSLSTLGGAGTLYPVQAVSNGWYRVMFSATGVVAANNNNIFIYPTTNVAAATGTVLAWGAQAENAVVPSSYIPTEATTVTRNADSLYWDIPALVPRELTVYVRGVDVGVFAGSATINSRVFGIGNTGLTGARFNAGRPSGSNGGFAQYSDGTTLQTAFAPAPSPLYKMFDVIETRAWLTSDWRPAIATSANGGAEVTLTGSASGSAAAFAEARLYLVGFSEGNPTAVTHVAIALGTKSRAEMRAIAGVP